MKYFVGLILAALAVYTACDFDDSPTSHDPQPAGKLATTVGGECINCLSVNWECEDTEDYKYSVFYKDFRFYIETDNPVVVTQYLTNNAKLVYESGELLGSDRYTANFTRINNTCSLESSAIADELSWARVFNGEVSWRYRGNEIHSQYSLLDDDEWYKIASIDESDTSMTYVDFHSIHHRGNRPPSLPSAQYYESFLYEIIHRTQLVGFPRAAPARRLSPSQVRALSNDQTPPGSGTDTPTSCSRSRREIYDSVTRTCITCPQDYHVDTSTNECVSTITEDYCNARHQQFVIIDEAYAKYACYPCAGNEYLDGNECKLCPDGKRSTGSGESSCRPCPRAGQIADEDGCSGCPHGTFLRGNRCVTDFKGVKTTENGVLERDSDGQAITIGCFNQCHTKYNGSHEQPDGEGILDYCDQYVKPISGMGPCRDGAACNTEHGGGGVLEGKTTNYAFCVNPNIPAKCAGNSCTCPDGQSLNDGYCE